jgi:hypothetical protein
MKTFAQFLKEAVETRASTEAKARGLVGNGHGDWYDKRGNFVAKTVGGKLKFFGQGDQQAKTQQDQGTDQSSMQKNYSNADQGQQQDVSSEDNGSGVAIVVGRFNPPSKFHENILRSGFNQAKRKGYEYRIYPSRIQDGQINPLNPQTKIQYLGLMFPEYQDYIVDSEEMRTIFDVLGSLYDEGYRNVDVVVGQDRLGEFQNLIHKAEGTQYEFDNVEVVSSGVKDPDSEVETPGSSSMMRAAAAIGDFERFSAGLPEKLNRKYKEEFFNTLAKALKVTEDTEVWKLIPELDYENLRWNYKHNNLYEVGSLVENMNTGLVGKIIRRGTNYLICVTEDGIMFKSWLTEVHEIGTDEYRQSLQKMTPYQKVERYSKERIPQTMPKNINIIRRITKK